jgi:hypothetical protein
MTRLIALVGCILLLMSVIVPAPQPTGTVGFSMTCGAVGCALISAAFWKMLEEHHAWN